MTATAKTLNVLVHVPTDALKASAKTALEFARLLNEARILLRHFSSPELTDFERRCHEQVGPVVEKFR